MRNTLLLLAVILQVLGPVSAQSQDTFLVSTSAKANHPWRVCRISATGAVLSTIVQLPGFMTWTMIMAESNASYILLGYYYQSTGAVFDLDANGVVTTIVADLPLVWPVNMVRNSDGDWILVNRQGTTYSPLEIYRLRGKTLSTLSKAPGIEAWAFTLDEDTGQLLVRGNTGSSAARGYFRVDPDTGAVTQFALYGNGGSYNHMWGARTPIFEGTTGALTDAPLDNNTLTTAIVRAHPDTGIVTLAQGPNLPLDLVVAGQRTAPVRYYLLGRSPGLPFVCSLFGLSADGRMQTWSNIRGIVPSDSSLLRVGSRNLTWFMDTPPNGRRLHLSFPGEAGRSYLVGLSLAGARPGPRLPDGREVPLVPDHLTVLCVNGGVPGVIEDTRGALDALGRARVKVDTNGFGVALKGTRAWAVALVFDPGAPAGIAHIAGPTLLQIKQ
jgi:hypothetical protein